MRRELRGVYSKPVHPQRRSLVRRGMAMLSALVAAACFGGGAAAQSDPGLVPSGAELGRAPAICLAEPERASALRVGLVSLAPAPLCSPSYQVIEIRNEAPTPLLDARFFVTPPLGDGEMSFTPLPGSTPDDQRYVEVSTDEGLSWRRVEAPTGKGTLDDPLEFSGAQIPALRRLGAAGERDDSVLVRWRASLGEAFGEPFASEALLGLSGVARDACGQPIRAPQRVARLSIDRPALIAGLEGRNVTRGGAFYRSVRAAPGDEIEWRAALENIGDAPAAVARGELWEEGRGQSGGEALTLDGVVPGARRTTTFRMRAGEGCAARVFRLTPSWGCAAPPDGEVAALSPLAEGYAVARLERAPDPNAINMSLKMIGEDGSERPGDRARVTVEIRNDGPPAFRPAALVTLPDGYAAVLDRPVELFSTDGEVSQAVWSSENSELAEDQAMIELQRADGGEASLDPDAFVQLRFDVERVRRSVLPDDRLSARLVFVSACGDQGRSRPARLLVEPRQSDLSATLTPLDAPIVGAPGAALRFRADIANSGDEAAQRLTASLTMGRAWSGATPAPEICKPAAPGQGAGQERRFVCTVQGAARPGSSISFEFDAVAGDLATPPDPTLLEKAAAALEGGDGADFSIVLTVEAYRGEAAAGAETQSPIAEARAESGAIGFRMSQKLLDEAGAEWPLDRPIDLGEPVTIEVDAQWWGAGRERIVEPVLIQTLPRTLAIQSASGAQDGDGVRAAVRAAQRQVLWGLQSMRGSGRFSGRVAAVAVDGGSGADEQSAAAETDTDAPAAAPAVATAEADTVFTLRGETYGVDALVSTATAAAPLERLYRKPDLRLDLMVENRSGGEVDGAAAEVIDEADPALQVAAGERVVVDLTLRNAGAGPGYVDWIEFETPKFVAVEPLGSDGLDNDGDGRIDEGDESEAALRESADGRIRLRWIRLPEGGGRRIGEARSRLAPGAVAHFPVALRVEQDLTPGAKLPLALRAQFGARPFARRQAAGRAVIDSIQTLTARRAEGALALTETRSANADPGTVSGVDIRREVQHGDYIEHRAILRMPPGTHRAARLVVSLPPALAGAEARALRIGPGVDCIGGGAAELERVERAGPAGGPATATSLIWRLGDCTADLEASSDERMLLMDLVAEVEDARPDLTSGGVALWRRPNLALWFERSADGDAAQAAAFRERHPLGVSALSLAGPLLQARLVSVEGAPGGVEGRGSDATAPPQFDAGDRFVAQVEALNKGDAPAFRASLGLAAAISLDCSSIEISSDQGADFAAEGAGCGGAATLRQPLGPGESAVFQISGRLSADAPIGRDAAARFALTGKAGNGAEAQGGFAIMSAAARPAPAPSLSATPAGSAELEPAEAGPAELADLAIGDALLLRSSHPLPEGSGVAAVAFRIRVADRSGASAPDALDALRLVEAAISRSDGSLTLGADPGRLNDRPAEERIPITGAVQSQIDADGWRRFTAPLGALSRGSASDGVSDAWVTFEAVAAFNDAPALRAGLQVEVEALTEIEGAPVARTRKVAARLAEPSLTIAALAEGVDGAVALGGMARFRAEICNVGGAPAYEVAVEGALPPGFRIAPGVSPRFYLSSAGPAVSGAAPERFPTGDVASANVDAATGGLGTVTVNLPLSGANAAVGSVGELNGVDAAGGVRLFARSTPGAALEPGRCAWLDAAARSVASAAQSLATARFAIASYASRPGATEAARRYLGGPTGRSALQTLSLQIEAPGEAEAIPGLQAVRRFVLRAPQALEAMRIGLEIEGGRDLEWSLWLDADNDGRLGAADQPWRDGALLARGGSLSVLASVEAPSDMGPRWRRSARLEASGVGASGRVAAGAAEFSLRAREERLGSLAARRVMAVDRDCDGDLRDETAQDATFEAAKEAARGECLTMRILFSNPGATSVESVSIEDAPPLGLIYEPGGARVTEAPDGLIIGPIFEPSAAASTGSSLAPDRSDGETPTLAPEGGSAKAAVAAAPPSGSIRFDFVGSLAPGAGGVVEYRLRLPAE